MSQGNKIENRIKSATRVYRSLDLFWQKGNINKNKSEGVRNYLIGTDNIILIESINLLQVLRE